MRTRLTEEDPYLEPYEGILKKRISRFKEKYRELAGGGSLADFALGSLYYGLHKKNGMWTLREWAPNAKEIYILCDANNWQCDSRWKMNKTGTGGDWEKEFSDSGLKEGGHFKLRIKWENGEGDRIPAYASRVLQDPGTKLWTAQARSIESPYRWKIKNFRRKDIPLLIYEAHPGMCLEEGKTASFGEFGKYVLPRIEKAGYNAIQFMALMEHPYYASFGYQVSSFFAVSSRFGTPEDFKKLVDMCHEKEIAVIMDIIHSHSVKNENEGLSRQDGTYWQYFHEGAEGYHPAWDSRCFDYGKNNVLHFLLSNCAYWLKEYNLDGFRFDGVTSMLYKNHGLGMDFDNYEKYFSSNSDEDALLYLSLANSLIHELKPGAVTIAEDMSGMPGLCRNIEIGGCGFDYRLAMGIPDFWIKLLKEKKDEEWNVEEIWGTLMNRRFSEKNIAYAESHDQALVGDKTIIFRLMDAAMYTDMSKNIRSIEADRAEALHKIIRLLTFSIGGDAYMNFMGNEFGHPEWIDFPREGNCWSYHYARRQWSLVDNEDLRYGKLAEFDKAMLSACAPSLKEKYPVLLKSHVEDHLLAYRRGAFLYVVNLHPDKAYTDYQITVDKGEYKLILSSDWEEFDGFGNIPKKLTLHTEAEGGTNSIKIYLPPRTASVYRKTAD